MKILVNSQAEALLVESFFDMIADMDMIEDIEKIDNELAVEGNEAPYLTSVDYNFLRQGFFNPIIKIDKTTYPLTIEDNVITGICTVCGTYTEGTLDGGEVSYDEFIDYCKEDSHKNWKCETCFFKED